MIWFIILMVIILLNIRSSSSNIIKCDPNHKWIYVDNIMVCDVCKNRPEDLM